MPRENPVPNVVSCVLSDAYTIERDQDTGWLTLFIGDGPRRNFSPATAKHLKVFLAAMLKSEEQVQTRLLTSGFSTDYAAKYEHGYLTLTLGAERLEFSVRSTRLLREFLEKELKKEPAQ